jgi:hypothetical protein
MATNNGGKSAGSLNSPASDGGSLISGGGASATPVPDRLLGHASGLVSANAASQIDVLLTEAVTEPIVVAQAAPQAQGIAAVSGGSTTGKVVGTITVVVGDVKIIGIDGVVRIAQVGDKVVFRETIVTGADGMVHIKLEDGRLIDMGFNGKLALDADVVGPEGGAGTASTTGIGCCRGRHWRETGC